MWHWVWPIGRVGWQPGNNRAADWGTRFFRAGSCDTGLGAGPQTREIWHLWVWQARAESPVSGHVPARIAHKQSSQTHWLCSLSKRARSSPWTSRSLCLLSMVASPADCFILWCLQHCFPPPSWKSKDLVINIMSEVSVQFRGNVFTGDLCMLHWELSIGLTVMHKLWQSINETCSYNVCNY